MATSVRDRSTRTQPNPLRRDSQAVHADLQALHAGSHVARITVNSVSRDAVRAAMRETGKTQKDFAITADVPESVLSDALNSRGRNLETDWILAQGDGFVRAWWKHVERALGLRPELQEEVDEQRMVELFTMLMRSRRPAKVSA